MKTFLFALVAALLIAGQLCIPVAAAAPSAEMAAVNCGDNYTVQYHDYLALIASYCGTTVADILALNPQIVNPNIIYAGQLLRMNSSAAPITTGTTPYYYYYGTTTGYARVSLSTLRADAGNTVTVYVSGFPANAEIDYRIGQKGADFSAVYDGQTAANGTASKTITIPADADLGEYWVVQVVTTGLKNVVSATSSSIYITDVNSYIISTGYARVSLSLTRAKVGDDVTVYVAGYPANTEIDYRVGKQGDAFSSVYDGSVASNGTTHQTITIPDGANKGEYWVVQVITTSLAKVVSVTSHSIYITE